MDTDRCFKINVMSQQDRETITFAGGVRAQISCLTVAGGVTEYHVMIHVQPVGKKFQEQMMAVAGAAGELLSGRLAGGVVLFKRYFLSDAANQKSVLDLYERESVCAGAATESVGAAPAYTIVEQPPLDGSKIALWMYVLVPDKQDAEGFVYTEKADFRSLEHHGYRHLFWHGTIAEHLDSKEQSYKLWESYLNALAMQRANLAEHCIRTWFFVQNVDVNYAGVVQARNEVFDREGLTCNTHFIASTGICGRFSTPQEIVGMEAYAIVGIRPEQIGYLYARDYLNPTYEYGVAFERGTYVDYGDRRQVFISGTASINNRGEVVYPGDIVRQTLRMWENVAALLAEAGMDFSDVGHMIVYLRDPSDYDVVNELFECRFPDIPRVFVWAPVCRPGWLIEMECMATQKREQNLFTVY